MIDSGSRSQVRPLESFERRRFWRLAIASFIATYPTSHIMHHKRFLVTPFRILGEQRGVRT